MSIPFTPAAITFSSLTQTLSSTVMATPEERVAQVEQEAHDNIENVLEARRAAYKTMVKNTVGQIRATIAEMRSNGQSEYAINRVICSLFQDFRTSFTDFSDKNRQFETSKAQVSQSNQSISECFSKCKPQFKKMALPIPPLDSVYLSRTDSSVSAPVAKDVLKQFLKTFPEKTKHPYLEQAVKCVGSSKILEFRKRNGRPKLLLVVAHNDHNSALSPSHEENCRILRALNSSYNVKYTVVSHVEDIYAQLRQLPKNSLTGIVIDAHGSPIRMDIAPRWNGRISDLRAAACLKDNSFIVLNSCFTGMLKGISPLYQLRDSLKPTGKKITLSAPKASCDALSLAFKIEPSKPLKFRFLTTLQFLEEDEKMLPGLINCQQFPAVDGTMIDFYDTTATVSTTNNDEAVLPPQD